MSRGASTRCAAAGLLLTSMLACAGAPGIDLDAGVRTDTDAGARSDAGIATNGDAGALADAGLADGGTKPGTGARDGGGAVSDGGAPRADGGAPRTDGGASRADGGVAVAQDDAELVSIDLPAQLDCGRAINAGVRFRNVGTTAWRNLPDSLGWKLGVLDPYPPLFLRGQARLHLGSDVVVPPGEAYNFQFTLTAPRAAGTHRLRLQMIHEGVRWFGPIVERVIDVSAENCPPTFDVDCPRTSAAFGSAVEEAIDFVEATDPQFFYFDAGFAGGAYALRDEIGFTYAVTRRLEANGFTAIVDAWAGDEISVKRSESLSENYDIVIGGNDRYHGGFVRRGSGAYRATCTPSSF